MFIIKVRNISKSLQFVTFFVEHIRPLVLLDDVQHHGVTLIVEILPKVIRGRLVNDVRLRERQVRRRTQVERVEIAVCRQLWVATVRSRSASL
jgi:hypothetical protein